MEQVSNLDLLASDRALANSLGEQGYRSIASIATTPRSAFVRSTNSILEGGQAERIHASAQAQHMTMNMLLTGLRADQNWSANWREQANLSSVSEYRPCDTALGPNAYLDALLTYATQNLLNNSEPIDQAWLEKTFCQPFGKLVFDCEASEAQVRQVRVCVEVLRTFLKDNTTSGSYLQKAYIGLLTGIGTSYEELQVAQYADDQARKALANRLGIRLSSSRPDQLDRLFLAPGKVSEQALAELFGLAVTEVNSIPVIEPQLLLWQQEYLRELWREADYPQDPGADRAPLIDPDLIGKDNLKDPVPGNAAYDLWEARRVWLERREEQLATLWNEQSTQRQGFEVVVQDALGIPASELLALAEARSKGEDITQRLHELSLQVNAFNYLVTIYKALGGFSSTLLADEIAAVFSILVQVNKRRLYADWREQERTGKIVLAPDFFQTPVPDPQVFPPPPPRTLDPWRATFEALLDWQTTLSSRIDQSRLLPQALRRVVGQVEDEHLPMLRDTLILTIPDGGNGLDAKAAWFTDNFQVDATLTGTQLTTRVGQAIETLQGLLWAIRIGQLEATHPGLTFVSQVKFDEEWPWIGSFATWRSSEMVKLYPENFMQPGLRPYQTAAFREVVDATRAYPSLTPQQARGIANTYATYFQDVCTLALDASCQARTRVAPDGDPNGAFRDLYYMFGIGGVSRKLYWSAFDPKAGAEHAQSYWTPVPGMSDVIEMVGAIPYSVEATIHAIHLFAIISLKGARKLVMTKYNLEKRTWDGSPTEIDAPKQAIEFTAVVEQRASEVTTPPTLVVRLADGTLYQGTLTEDGASLGQQGWTVWAIKGIENNLAVQAFVRGAGGTWWLVLRIPNGKMRVVNPNGNIGEPEGRYVGVLNYPDTTAFLVYRMNTQAGAVKYALLSQPMQSANFPVSPPPIRIAATNGFSAGANSITAAWYTADQAYRCDVALSNNLPRPGTLIPATPSIKGPFQITDALSEQELQRRRQEIDLDFEANKDAPQYIRDYLDEAYYFVPIQLATQLQAAGQYITALDWLRTVYDYTEPAHSSKAKVYPGLRQAEDIRSVYAHFGDWLHDPLDAYSIALTRPTALTRFVLLAEIGCFLAYADSEFSRDTAESVPRARTLYINAGRLLDAFKNIPALPELAQQISASRRKACDEGWQEQQYALLLTSPIVSDTVRMVGDHARSNGRMDIPLSGLFMSIPPFVTPPNPVLQGLSLHTAVNLYKIRSGCNIAGMTRQLDPYAVSVEVGSGFPVIGGQGELPVPQANAAQPTPYRYSALIERAKQLVGLATQIENAMLAALEKRDAEYYTLMRARQDLGLARANVQLQDLRVREAQGGVVQAQLSQQRSQTQVDYYQARLDEGTSDLEKASLILMGTSAGLQVAAAGLNFIAAALPGSVSIGFPSGGSVSYSPQGSATAAAAGLSSLAGAASTTGSILSTLASYERRKQEWEFQKNVAAQDVLINEQQVTMAQDHVRVVGQDRNIASLQADNASANVEYLANKFTNFALYDWMSQVLEGVYRSILQQATAVAQVASSQLAFERQETPPAIIKTDYWETPAGGINPSGSNGSQDNKGLTGSYRLLQDIYRLDEYAFSTARRKLQLTKTISLARLAPAEFQRMKESGTLQFATPIELFDRDFPGHYLRLINRVRLSVIALIPATESIKATLATAGVSRVVVGSNDVFRPVTMRRQPELVALTSARDATGMFELQNAQPDMLLPFEGIGVDTTWLFSLPRATNLFDYDTIADVLVTIEYTALHNDTYRAQVLRSLPTSLSADRPFSFRQELPDQWYDLHNPDQTATPMTVRFKTSRADFPPNLLKLKISQVALYFRRAPSFRNEVHVDHLLFNGKGGPATSIDGIISTLRGNASSWIDITQSPPEGEWELAFPDTPETRKLFTDGLIEDILFDITYTYRTPDWTL